MTSPGETRMMEAPPAPKPQPPPQSDSTMTTRRMLDEEDELNQSVNFLTNPSTTTTATATAIGTNTSRSSSFGTSESPSQVSSQPQHHHHTTGETKFSKIVMRVVFGSCMFTIFATLVRWFVISQCHHCATPLSYRHLRSDSYCTTNLVVVWLCV